MKKKLLFPVILIFAVICAFFLYTAQKAKSKSDEILENFKTVDNSLKRSNDSIESFNLDREKMTRNMVINCRWKNGNAYGGLA